jgi:dTDP-L-rhamnose 4-epimerase
MERILITGGAGFIGSHLCQRLVSLGFEVTVYDNLSPQIHGFAEHLGLPPEAAFLKGDIRDRDGLETALEGQDIVVHLAAETGTGQSMYELTRYEQVNVYGTALLMDLITRQKVRTVRKVVVASSRAIYGEGAYRCVVHGIVYPKTRTFDDMSDGEFDCRCPHCGQICESAPTEEHCPFSPSSYYGITKQVQEQTVLLVGQSLGISAYALRYQNVYGPGQSLANPYTGILAVFTNLARANRPIRIFEDGKESRDFVHVQDVVDATCLAIAQPGTEIDRFNVGGGEKVDVLTVAQTVVDFFRSTSKIEVTGEFRTGDIRHNLANLSYVQRRLGYRPKRIFKLGVAEFLSWAALRELKDNGFANSMDELRSRGLLNAVSLKG